MGRRGEGGCFLKSTDNANDITFSNVLMAFLWGYTSDANIKRLTLVCISSHPCYSYLNDSYQIYALLLLIFNETISPGSTWSDQFPVEERCSVGRTERPLQTGLLVRSWCCAQRYTYHGQYSAW